jgi:hypothetical protein
MDLEFFDSITTKLSSEQIDKLKEVFSELTPFCEFRQKSNSENRFIISHPYLSKCRHEISLNQDQFFIFNHYDYYNKISVSKNSVVQIVKNSIKQSLDKSINRIISNVKENLLEEISFKSTKIGPFNITGIDVVLVRSNDEMVVNGQCSIELSIVIYDNFLFRKNIRQNLSVIVKFCKNDIIVSLGESDLSGVASGEAYFTDSLIIDLIRLKLQLGE